MDSSGEHIRIASIALKSNHSEHMFPLASHSGGSTLRRRVHVHERADGFPIVVLYRVSLTSSHLAFAQVRVTSFRLSSYDAILFAFTWKGSSNSLGKEWLQRGQLHIVSQRSARARSLLRSDVLQGSLLPSLHQTLWLRQNCSGWADD